MDSLETSIFNIRTEKNFEECVWKVFQLQSEQCAVYRSFLKSLNRPTPESLEEIPFLPISFFKTHPIKTGSFEEELLFRSSGTGGDRSQHLVQSTALYKRSFEKSYRLFLGNPEEQIILALLPNYIEQGESSLVYMVNELIKLTNSDLSGFILDNPDEISDRYTEAIRSGKKMVLFGVSYALLDLCEQGVDLSEATVLETGGMKGKRKEITKVQLHDALRKGLNHPTIASEYGMTELLSQAYSINNLDFRTPPWMRIMTRQANDPFAYTKTGKTGAINIIDLANVHSCSFIATDDLGQIVSNGFRVMGRLDQSDIRGCNLLVQ